MMAICHNKGKNETKITFITWYCSVRGTSSGPVYSQHLCYMVNNKDIPESIVCLRQLFEYDLKTLIDSKIGAGHQNIMAGDFNSDYLRLQT